VRVRQRQRDCWLTRDKFAFAIVATTVAMANSCGYDQVDVAFLGSVELLYGTGSLLLVRVWYDMDSAFAQFVFPTVHFA
jgi:hypothetical protein